MIISYFLLRYDRDAQMMVSLQEFSSSDREQAVAARLQAQIAAARGGRLDREEIVLLEADSIEVLHQTHGSYFLTIEELGDRMAAAI